MAKHVRPSALSAALVAVLGMLGGDLLESRAEAGFLRNGVRPGERVRPGFMRAPAPGARARVRPPGDAATEKPVSAAPTQRAARHGWFWAAHSTAKAAAGQGRWSQALLTMQDRRARGQGLIPVDTIRAIRADWGPQVAAAARARNVSEILLLAVIAVESGGRPGARSPKEAQGLMQLIPATAARFGVADAYEPAANIAGGAAYLDWLLREFDDDILLALAGYNAGENAVHRHQGVPPYTETRDYVVLVMDAVAAAGALCDEAPAGPRERCRWKPEV